MQTYTVAIGPWVKDHQRGLTWEAAHGRVSAELAAFKDDDCDSCRGAAAEELQRLNAAQPGAFQAEVDGKDYLIVPE